MFDPGTMALIGGGSALLSGILQSNATTKAAQEQSDATNREINLQEQQWQTQQQNQAPWLAAGKTALSQLQQRTANPFQVSATSDAGYQPMNTVSNPGNFSFATSGANVDPSYTWRLNQGLNAVNSSAAAKGGYWGGNTATALTNYGQGAASQEYQNQYNRWQTNFSDYMNQSEFNSNQYNQAFNRQMDVSNTDWNRLSSLAGVGQTATNNLNNAGNTYATNVGNLATSNAANSGQSATQQANIWGNVISNALNQTMGAWGQQQTINQLQNSGSNPWANYWTYNYEQQNPNLQGPAF